MDDIFIQTGRHEGRDVAVVVTPREDGYIAHCYDLNGNEFVQEDSVEFCNHTKQRNYKTVQEFVRGMTGAEAIFYNPDADVLTGPHQAALESVLEEHVVFS